MKTTTSIDGPSAAAGAEFGPSSDLEAVPWREGAQLYVSRDGETVRGPFTEEHVRLLWRKGKVRADAFACWEGEDRWWPLGLARPALGETENQLYLRGVGYIFVAAAVFLLPIDWRIGLGLIAVAACLLCLARR